MVAIWDNSPHLVDKSFQVVYPANQSTTSGGAEMTSTERDSIINDVSKHPLLDLEPILDQVRNTDLTLPPNVITAIETLLTECKNEVETLSSQIGTLIQFISASCRELSEKSCLLVQRSRQIRLGEYLISPRTTRHLPQDILEQIFLACWESQDFTESLSITRVPLQLASVSHRWRAIALSMPTLWSNIRIRESSSLDLAKAWFHRCSRPSLVLDLYGCTLTSKQVDDTLDILKDPSIRLRKLELYVPQKPLAERVWPVLFGSPSDELEELVLLDKHQPDTIPNSIRRLYLHHPPASWIHSPPPPDLTVLCIAMLDSTTSLHWTMVENILFHCPNLQRVTLRVIEAGLQPQNTQRLGSVISPTTRENLVYFGITVGCTSDGLPNDFLGNFNFPNLRVFEYKMDKEAGTRPAWLITHPLLAHIRRFTLQIEPSISTDDFQSMLSMASSLEEFSICCTDASLSNLFQLLSSSSGATSTQLLPSLKSFHVGEWDSGISKVAESKPLLEFVRAWSPEVRGASNSLTHLTFQMWYEERNESQATVTTTEIQEANPSMTIKAVRYTTSFLLGNIPLLFTTYPPPFNGVKTYETLDIPSGKWKPGVGHIYNNL